MAKCRIQIARSCDLFLFIFLLKVECVTKHIIMSYCSTAEILVYKSCSLQTLTNATSAS